MLIKNASLVPASKRCQVTSPEPVAIFSSSTDPPCGCTNCTWTDAESSATNISKSVKHQFTIGTGEPVEGVMIRTSGRMYSWYCVNARRGRG